MKSSFVHSSLSMTSRSTSPFVLRNSFPGMVKVSFQTGFNVFFFTDVFKRLSPTMMKQKGSLKPLESIDGRRVAWEIWKANSVDTRTPRTVLSPRGLGWGLWVDPQTRSRCLLPPSSIQFASYAVSVGFEWTAFESSWNGDNEVRDLHSIASWKRKHL